MHGHRSFTRRDVLEGMEAEQVAAGAKPGTVANLKSAMLAWVEYRAETLDSPVLDPFAPEHFVQRRDAFLNGATTGGAKPTTITTIRSHLNTWRGLAMMMIAAEAVDDDPRDSFLRELQPALDAKGMTVAQATKAALHSTGTKKPELVHAWVTIVRGWFARRSLPTTQTGPRLTALEKVLDIPKGTLTRYRRPRG